MRAEARATGKLDEARIEEVQRLMLAEVRVFPLVDMRKALGLSKADMANLIGAPEFEVSRIERGDLDHTEIATVRAYIGALGGDLEIVARFGDERITIG